MWKSIILILLLAFAVFGSLSAIISRPYTPKQQDGLETISREFNRGLRSANQVGPVLGRALSNVQIDLPVELKKKQQYGGPAHIDANLSGQDFTGKPLANSNFNGTFLTGANFQNAILDKSGFEGAQGQEINFINAQLASSALSGGIFNGSDFSGAILRKVTARAGRFARAKFEGADLSFGRFSGSDFANASLEGVYGVGAIFVNANLSGANLKKADLSGARLDRARLHGAELAEADLHLASLNNTDFTGVDLRTIKNLTAEQLAFACGGPGTVLPEGMTITACDT